MLGTDPESGREIAAKNGRYGPYVTELLPEGTPEKEKPRTGSLFKTMSLDTITLEDALRLLSLPRVLGTGPDGAEIVAQNGRYGPFVKMGAETRSLESEEQLFTLTLEEATDLLAQPKVRRGRGQERRSRHSSSSAPILRAGNRSWSRTAASGRTSRTARPTPACVAATRSSR